MYLKQIKTASLTALLLIALISAAVPANAELTLQPSVTVKESYDSNAHLLPRNSGQSGTFITNLSPSLSAASNGKSVTLKGSYSFNAVFDHSDRNQDYETHNAAVSAYIKTGKSSHLSISDNFSLTKGGADESALSGIYLSRASIHRNNVSLNYGTGIGNFWTTGLTLSNSTTLYSDPALIDSESNSASLSLDYKLSRSTTINSGYSFNRTSYETAGSTARKTHNITIGASKDLTPSLKTKVSTGVLYSDSISGKYDWTLAASISKENKRYQSQLAYTRNVIEASGLSAEVEINEQLSFSGKYNLKQKISINASAVGSRTRSQPDRSVDVSSVNTSIGADWSINPSLSLNITLSRYIQWVDTSSATSMQRDQLFFGLTYRPAAWRL